MVLGLYEAHLAGWVWVLLPSAVSHASGGQLGHESAGGQTHLCRLEVVLGMRAAVWQPVAA